MRKEREEDKQGILDMRILLNDDASDILLWAKFINAERKEEFDMLASRNKYIKSAYEQLRVISQSTEKRLEYEAREKATRDHQRMALRFFTRILGPVQ